VSSEPELEDGPRCPICWHDERNVAFQCGHLACERCSLIVSECPLCRAPVEQRLKLYV
jgi:hypothetical protein